MKTGKLLRRKQILNRAWNLGGNAGLEVLESRMLLSAPYVTVMSPFEAGQSVGVSTKVSVRFDQGMNPATISSSTFQLFDSFNNQVSGRISYNSVNQTVTFDANAPLAYSTGYRAVVKGGTSGVKNSNNEAMGGDVQWTFTTSAAPEEGPGGPILVVTAGSNAFSSYYAEILRAEGLNEFATADLSSVSISMLASYDVVILGEASLTSGQVGMFTDWVTSGGNLIAMRPDRQLSNLLGLNYAGSTQTEGYLLVNTTSGPGVGITGETMQFHGVADRYTINDAVSIATLYSSASNATSYPAVTVRTVGTQGGQAAAFTFDLARSIVYTRQGNPAWAGQERDNAAGSGTDVIRPDDLFYGGNVADWVDLNKVSIPQADEQQRLLANMVTQMNADQMPLPRFWYLPDGAKAALIMTGDDHAYGSGAVSDRFDNFLENSPSGSSASSWTANHGTVYMFPSTNVMSREQAAYYTANGFEIALHVQSSVGNFESAEQLNEFYSTQLAAFNALYPNLPTPSTHRMHAIIWSDYTSQPEVEFGHRIRLDTNYYYYPDFWMQNYPGLFTGSGMPMRFATANGQMIDVYQVATQMTDESSQAYPATLKALLDKATGSQGYYGMFCANVHTDVISPPGESEIVTYARSQNVSIISSKQALDWTDGRNGSSFQNLNWNSSNGTLSFSVVAAVGANGLQAMLPTRSASRTLRSITRNGIAVPYTIQTIKGIEYAFFAAGGDGYVASYDGDVTVPAISNVTATPRVYGTASVTWTTATAASSRIEYGTSPTALDQTVSDPALAADHFLALSNLLPNTKYYYRITSTDSAGNTQVWPSSADSPASFISAGEAFSIWSSATPSGSEFLDGNPYELGVKFKASMDGYIAGIRFYKGPNNVGVHIGNLWDLAGNNLATATFASETADGWQTVLFSQPVAIKANTTYVASYHTNGNYWLDRNAFVSAGVSNGPLYALANGEQGGNGVLAEGAASKFPTISANGFSYGVDVVFAQMADTTPPGVTSQTPAPNARNTPVNTAVTITFNEAVDPTTVTGTNFQLTDGTAAVAASVSYNPDTYTVTLTPNSPLANSTSYTAILSGVKDRAGNAMAGSVSWSFTTVAASIGGSSIWSDATVPSTVTQTDPFPYELGVKFKASMDGYIAGIRFYKGPSNVGEHIGNLWDMAGNNLATATFASETADGWQTVLFSQPVAIKANTTYVASYHTNGNYSLDWTTFASGGVSNGPLYALANGEDGGNGVLAEGAVSKFPTISANGRNYWVDVVFVGDLDTTAPSVTGRTPGIDATGVPLNTTVTVTFNEAVDPATINGTNFQLKNGNTLVPANVSYNPATRMATLTPTNPLAGLAQYTATISGVRDSAGNAMTAPVSWSFTTIDSQAPTVVSQSPAPNGTSIPVTTTISVTFSERLTFPGVSVEVKDAQNHVVTGSVSYNDGTRTVTFTPEAALASFTLYTVTVTGVADLAGNVMSSPVAWSFTTADIQAPTVINQSPGLGAVDVGVDTSIAATFSETVQPSTIIMVLRDAANNVVPTTLAYNSTTNTATWTPGSLLSSQTTYTVTISEAQDAFGNPMTAPKVWSFTTADVQAPSITDRSPLDGATDVPLSTVVTVTFSEPMNPGTITAGNFQLKNGDMVVPATLAYNADTWTATLTPSGPLSSQAQYTVTVSGVQDLAGNVLAAPATWSFTTALIDTTPPSVTSRTPGIDATGVPLNTTVTVTFNETVDPATINGTNFQLKSGNTLVAASVSYNPATHIATLTPSNPLAGLAQYTASVSGVRDMAGNGMAASVSWSFTTADTQAPTITDRSPASGATNVPLSTTVTVTFSEAMDPATINGTNIQLKNGNTLVPASVSYNPATHVATLTPNAALASSTSYTVNVGGVKDAAGNALVAVNWSFTTVTVDTTAPTVTGQSPTPNTTGVSPTTSITITFSEAVQWDSAAFEVRNAANELVPASVSYNATTRTATLTPAIALANSVTYTAKVSGILDLAGNAMASPVTWSFTTAAPMTGTYSVWSPSTTPRLATDADANSVEVGFKFRSDVEGYVTGIRFYKGTSNTGTHTGSLWSKTGTRLASVVFTNETATGWQTAYFSTPVFISANATYVASYFAPKGHYAVDEMYFSEGGIDSGPLHALKSGVDGANGVYRYGASSGFPTSSYMGSNYWVDVVFAPNPTDTQAPTVIGRSPLNNSSNVPINTSITAMFSEAVQTSGISFVLRGPGGSTVAASVSYDAATKTATLVPNSPLANGTTYTVTVSGASDLAGNVMAGPDTWSFTTIAADLQSPTVIGWSPVANATDVAVGSLVWVAFSEPIDVASLSFTLHGPNSSVIPASVSYDSATRTATLTPLTALASSTSYTVTVSGAKDLAGNSMSSPESWSFTTASTHVPAIVELSPMPNATNVSVNTSVTASFDEPVQPGSIVFVLRDSTNALVPTTFTYNSVTQTATWTPDAPLASHMTYTATISAATDLLGNNMNDAVSWSFTTVDAQPPTVVSQSPLANAVGVSTGTNITVTFSEPIQPGSITLLLRDPSNQPVAGNLTYNEATRTATFVPASPLASLAGYSATVSGVQDLAGNVLASALSWSFVTDGSTGTGPYKLFSDTAIPGTITDPDQSAVELGVRFRSDMSGYITGVRFYKGSNNTGTHIGNLWSSTGTLLASATFINETATGWQTVVFSAPVAISANTVYVASYFAPKGQYSIDERGLLGGVNSGPLHVLPDGEDGSNGVYRYGSRSGFPTTGYMASNYWVDVLFSTVYVDNVAPTVITTSPTSNASNVALTASVTVKFSEAVQASTISCVVKDSSNNVVLASLTYDNSTKTVTLKPRSPLLAGTTYTVTVSGARDLAGNLMSAPFTWSFRTVNA